MMYVHGMCTAAARLLGDHDGSCGGGSGVPSSGGGAGCMGGNNDHCIKERSM